VEIVGLQLSDYTVAKRTLSQYFESVQGNRQQQLSLTKKAQKADESILQYTTRVQELRTQMLKLKMQSSMLFSAARRF
jgi:hypothetical protein